MPLVRESDPPLRSVEDEIVEAFERALKTKWREDKTPLVWSPLTRTRSRRIRRRC